MGSIWPHVLRHRRPASKGKLLHRSFFGWVYQPLRNCVVVACLVGAFSVIFGVTPGTFVAEEWQRHHAWLFTPLARSSFVSIGLFIALCSVAWLWRRLSWQRWRRGYWRVSDTIIAYSFFASLSFLVIGAGFVIAKFFQPTNPDEILVGDPAIVTRGPIQWKILAGPVTFSLQNPNGPSVLTLAEGGQNVSNKNLQLSDVYIEAAYTKKRFVPQLTSRWGSFHPATAANIRPGADFLLIASFSSDGVGMPIAEFAKEWSRIYFVAKYEGFEFRQLVFDQKMTDRAVASLLAKRETPLITPKESQ
jgi:hypothetical protein